MTDAQKIALVDALAAHFVATLDSYYDVSNNPPTNPRYDSGAAQTESTHVHTMEVKDGWLDVEMWIQGWAEEHTFSIELPLLTRDDAT